MLKNYDDFYGYELKKRLRVELSCLLERIKRKNLTRSINHSRKVYHQHLPIDGKSVDNLILKQMLHNSLYFRKNFNTFFRRFLTFF